MELYKQYILYISICFGLFISPFCTISIEAKDFVVVIDAGHGGHDPGALGKFSKEKTINLNVALKLGKQIKRNCPDVKWYIPANGMYLFLLADVQILPITLKQTCSFPFIPILWQVVKQPKVPLHDTRFSQVGR